MHVNSSLWTAASRKMDTTKTSILSPNHIANLPIPFPVISLPNPGYIISIYLTETVTCFHFHIPICSPWRSQGGLFKT